MLKTPMRDKTKFASAFTKWVYDNCGSKFYFGDVDGIAYKLSNNTARLYEWKYPNAALSSGQKRYYAKMAELIILGIKEGALNPQSGVFVVYGEPPFQYGAKVYSFIDDKTVSFTREELIDFVKCDIKFPR